MTIGAGLSIQSLFQRLDPGSTAATLRAGFVSDEGDPFTILNVFDGWVRAKPIYLSIYLSNI